MAFTEERQGNPHWRKFNHHELDLAVWVPQTAAGRVQVNVGGHVLRCDYDGSLANHLGDRWNITESGPVRPGRSRGWSATLDGVQVYGCSYWDGDDGRVKIAAGIDDWLVVNPDHSIYDSHRVGSWPGEVHQLEQPQPEEAPMTTTLDPNRPAAAGDRVRHEDGRTGVITDTEGDPFDIIGSHATWSYMAHDSGWVVSVRWDDTNHEELHVELARLARLNAESEAEPLDDAAAIAVFARLLRQEAVDRGWCGEYEQFVAKVNREVGRDILEQRQVQYRGQVTVNFDFEADRNGDARAAADVIRLAIEECVTAHPFAITNLSAATAAHRI